MDSRKAEIVRKLSVARAVPVLHPSAVKYLNSITRFYALYGNLSDAQLSRLDEILHDATLIQERIRQVGGLSNE